MLGDLRGDLLLVGIEIDLRLGHQFDAILLLARLDLGRFLLALRGCREQLLVIGGHLLEDVDAFLDLARRGGPIEDAEEELIDDLAVVLLGQDELGDLIRRIADRLGEGAAVDHRHHGAHLQAGGALAFAGRIARRPTERRQEAPGQIDARIGKRRGSARACE